METITREIIRNHDGHEAVYIYTTYDVVLDIAGKRLTEIARKLFNYLADCLTCEIPERLLSPSGMPTLLLQTELIAQDVYVQMAKAAEYRGLRAGQHAKIQGHFLANNPATFATELPVFDEKMTGCIDVLNYDVVSDSIQILDFKPNAHKEKHAATQLYWYRELLSKQTEIPKSKIECFYFDDMNCYKVKF